MGRPGIWASPSPGTAAPLPPARAGLPGSLARCQARRARAAGWGKRRQWRTWPGALGSSKHPSREAGARKVRAPGWVPGWVPGWAPGRRQAVRRAGPSRRKGGGGGEERRESWAQSRSVPGLAAPSQPASLPPSLGAPPRVHGGGEAGGVQGARAGGLGAVAAGRGRPSEAGPGAVKEKNIPRPANCCSQLFFFFFKLLLLGREKKKSSASSGGGCKKDAEF